MTVLQKLLDTSALSRENVWGAESSQAEADCHHSYFVAAPRGLKEPGLDVRVWEAGAPKINLTFWYRLTTCLGPKFIYVLINSNP